ncbi:MAG TPA: homoserine dehydrogenase [Peptococcaceae bacterium]|nr:MAG: Homoserine dehydrogenase [Clostridia bacterium 41_269]HBT20528.1 homoserine dehydrogenase [Peptococcaceae bacterium]
MNENSIKIGLLGLGTVGSGVVEVLNKNSSVIQKKVGRKIEIKGILVRDKAKKRNIDVPQHLLTTNPDDILEDPEIDIVVEVMGTIDFARRYILKAFENKKSVVTANKDLIALHGKELFEAAEKAGRDLFFEASVAGGIPIIRPLKECLSGNRISRIMGIINGTTNYILTKMSRDNMEFNDALAEAQRLGYAESDPTEDIEGFDAARKIAILASIAFNSRVTYKDVYVEGITKINSYDIRYAEELGYAVKLLGIAKEVDGELDVRVHPVFIPTSHALAAVSDEFNAIFVEGDAVGEAMFYGKGAGKLPTASAVIGDIISASRNIIFGMPGRVGCTCFDHKKIKPIQEVESKFYLRLLVKDQPGVLASIAGVFGNSNVSIASVIQKRIEGDMAEIVLVTHRVKEANLRDALKIIEGLSVVGNIGNVIRVEGSDT